MGRRRGINLPVMGLAPACIYLRAFVSWADVKRVKQQDKTGNKQSKIPITAKTISHFALLSISSNVLTHVTAGQGGCDKTKLEILC